MSVAAVFTNAVADRYGAGGVVAFGALCTVGEPYLMGVTGSSAGTMLSGILLGFGMSGTGITSLVGAVGRAAPGERRIAAMLVRLIVAGRPGLRPDPLLRYDVLDLGRAWPRRRVAQLADPRVPGGSGGG